MPEGHTLHRLARDLTAAFDDSPVASSSPQGRFGEAALLDGAVFEGAEAYGKHLFVHLDRLVDDVVHVHLGLYGGFAISSVPADGVPEPRGAVRWRLVSSDAYADLRGPTACQVLAPEARGVLLDRLGPDPLRDDADPDAAWQRIRRSRAPLATLLMDQAVIAGIGNVYRAEVLFRHRLDPFMQGRLLRRPEWTALWGDLVELMRAGVRSGRIETVRPEHAAAAADRASGVPGRRRRAANYVYRQTGRPCVVCGTEVRTEEIAARHLYWCPRCQRRTRRTRPS